MNSDVVIPSVAVMHSSLHFTLFTQQFKIHRDAVKGNPFSFVFISLNA